MTCFAAVVASLARTPGQAIPVGFGRVIHAGWAGLFWTLHELTRDMKEIACLLMTTGDLHCPGGPLCDRSPAGVSTELLVLAAYTLTPFPIAPSLFVTGFEGDL